jgi:uncharacterized protein (DUF1810 family)
MKSDADLNRFLEAQRETYDRALAEIKRGHKQSHWMWYIFPQLADLGLSSTAKFYGIKDVTEASAYLAHPVLGQRLIDISTAMLQVEGKTANQILGSPDDLKLRSSMTLFSLVQPTNPVFQAVLDKYYGGELDEKTMELVSINRS